MKKINLILLLLIVSGCATKSVLTLGNEKFMAVANDSTGLPSVEDSLSNATELAKVQCGERKVIIESVANRNDSNNFPETSLTFHCE